MKATALLCPASDGPMFVPWTGYGPVLESLVVGAPIPVSARAGLASIDSLELLDACSEDRNGRLPHEVGYDPGY